MKHRIFTIYHNMKGTLGKQNLAILVTLLFAIIIICIISPYLPDEHPDKIRKELIKQGYNVETVEFTYVKDGEDRRERIYRSSVPIDYEGYYVNQWSVFSITFSSYSPFVYYIVKPYQPKTSISS